MKRLSQIVAAVVVAFLGPLVIVSSASAAMTCGIGFTGPDSQNNCTSREAYQCSIENENKITINSTTTQQGYSGSISLSGNTSGGNAATGSVKNTSGQTFNVSVTNSTQGEVNTTTCLATVTVPATETPETVTPTTPVSTAIPIETLPVTSGGSFLSIAAAVVGGVVTVAALAVVALLIYRRSHIS